MRRSDPGLRLSPRPDEIPPIVTGIGPLPRPQRFYFAFARAIETTAYAGRDNDQTACLELRGLVQKSIERRIAFLLRQRARDPKRTLAARLRKVFGPRPTR